MTVVLGSPGKGREYTGHEATLALVGDTWRRFHGLELTPGLPQPELSTKDLVILAADLTALAADLQHAAEMATGDRRRQLHAWWMATLLARVMAAQLPAYPIALAEVPPKQPHRARRKPADSHV